MLIYKRAIISSQFNLRFAYVYFLSFYINKSRSLYPSDRVLEVFLRVGHIHVFVHGHLTFVWRLLVLWPVGLAVALLLSQHLVVCLKIQISLLSFAGVLVLTESTEAGNSISLCCIVGLFSRCPLVFRISLRFFFFAPHFNGSSIVTFAKMEG